MAPLPPEGTAAAAAAVAATPPSSAFCHLPFAFPLVCPLKPPALDGAASVHNAGFCSALLSGADRFFKEFAAAASEHPIFKIFLSLRSSFQSLCQVQCSSLRVKCLPPSHCFAAILPGDSVAGLVVANGVTNFLNIYNTLLVIRLVLTWFPNSPSAIVSPLSTICDPYLNIFRGIIPPLGGTLDLSPILAFFVLNAFMSTAAALPAELPDSAASQHYNSNHQGFSNLTTSQEKWMRRVCGKRSMKSEDAK